MPPCCRATASRASTSASPRQGIVTVTIDQRHADMVVELESCDSLIAKLLNVQSRIIDTLGEQVFPLYVYRTPKGSSGATSNVS
jgi:hypothetical protein